RARLGLCASRHASGAGPGRRPRTARPRLAAARGDEGEGLSSDLEARLEAIIRASDSLMAVMETARRLDLPDWMIFSGAIYQRVLNHLTGRDVDYGIKDYDLGYFDPDTSYEAEDAVIRRVAAAFDPPLREMVE